MKILTVLLFSLASFSASAAVGHIQYFSFDNPVYYPIFGDPALCVGTPPCEVHVGSDSCKVAIVRPIARYMTIVGYNAVYRLSGYDFCFKVKNKPVVIGQ